jgi:hypothetical protein
MIEQALIPAMDPSPLPAPYWIFKLLLILTFVLHIVAMNFLLGSGLLALWAKILSRRNEYAQRLLNEIMHLLPVLLPATITLGVAPLLFLQVLYGQFFYASSIIIGWPWFLVLVFLTIAYYGFYFGSFRKGRDIGKAAWVVSISLLLVFIIGFIYTNNITLAMTPERWHPKYFADPAGWNLNWGEPTLIPRFLHFFFAAMAVGGLFISLRGLIKKRIDLEYGRYLAQFGGKAFMYATMVQIIIGLWFFVSLPRAQRMLFMGDSMPATFILALGILGAIGGIMLVSGALHQQESDAGFYAGMGVTGLVIVFMTISRDTLRDAYVQPYLKPMAATTQWGVFLLFLMVFLSGLVLWLIMMKRYRFLKSAVEGQPASTEGRSGKNRTSVNR